MKEFLLLIKGNDMHLVSPEVREQRQQNYKTWMQKMMDEGRYLNGQSLEPRGNYLKNKDTVITDGPYLEPKEMIGGFVCILANDIKEATEIAKTCPLLEHYEIYVRPLVNMNEPK